MPVWPEEMDNMFFYRYLFNKEKPQKGTVETLSSHFV